jgi:hypothetical protein
MGVTMPMDMNEENHRPGVERNPHASPAPETMRVRCPHCRKLYMVQFVDVQEAKPRFECVQCHSRFWLSMADMDFSTEVTGIPVQFKEPPRPKPTGKFTVKPVLTAVETEPCPKCFKPVVARTSECPHCGVLIKKVRELSLLEDAPCSGSPELAAAWRKVVNDYGDESLHAKFISMAQGERNLAYAAAQYGQMLKLMPADETTRGRAREVQALALALTPGLRRPLPREYVRLWQVPLAAATLMMVVGFFLPVFRNMVGVGAAILFIAIAIQIQSRRRT